MRQEITTMKRVPRPVRPDRALLAIERRISWLTTRLNGTEDPHYHDREERQALVWIVRQYAELSEENKCLREKLGL